MADEMEEVRKMTTEAGQRINMVLATERAPNNTGIESDIDSEADDESKNVAPEGRRSHRASRGGSVESGTGTRPHRCDWPNCNKRSIQKLALTKHFEEHTLGNEHVCQNSSSLGEHKAVHLKENPFKCNVVGRLKTFRRIEHLMRHSVAVHGRELNGEKVYYSRD
ncbi:hypothetical protein LTR51_000216 [Lithohypha guttulata]|nr:hypothetical protein LTR51_000216 [Lithohypha guttulata]